MTKVELWTPPGVVPQTYKALRIIKYNTFFKFLYCFYYKIAVLIKKFKLKITTPPRDRLFSSKFLNFLMFCCGYFCNISGGRIASNLLILRGFFCVNGSGIIPSCLRGIIRDWESNPCLLNEKHVLYLGHWATLPWTCHCSPCMIYKVYVLYIIYRL